MTRQEIRMKDFLGIQTNTGKLSIILDLHMSLLTLFNIEVFKKNSA